MPVPTETFWNIRKLNRVFAVSAVLLFVTFAWAVLQDYDKAWREPQRSGKIWEAALVDEKLHQDFTPEKRAQAAALQVQIDQLQDSLNRRGSRVQSLTDQVKQKDSDRANLEFRLNTLKANVGVMETQLQNAITGGDGEEQKRLTAELNSPDYRPRLKAMTDQLATIKDDIFNSRLQLKEETAGRDVVQKQLTQLTEARDSMTKKLASLDPSDPNAHLSFFERVENKLSATLRAAPLMQFMNPAEKVQQTVVSDVQTDLGGFKKVETLDRCTTCHVNIANKEFTREKIQSYLEEQVATSRSFRYAVPDPNRPASLVAPTANKPGASAMPEFWHAWGRKLLPPDQYAKTNTQVRLILAAVGRVKVVVDGVELHAGDAKYEGNPATQPSVAEDQAEAQRKQDRILVEAIDALLRADPANRTLNQPRNVAMQYGERLRTMLKAQLPAAEYKELENRYRYAMVDVVNTARKKQGLAALDPSPVLLAHPRLDLYVDVDSKHPIESSEGKIGVGCTSCHDGSPEETNFVLAAHVARPIWVDSKTGEPILAQQVIIRDKPEKVRSNLADMLEAVFPRQAIFAVTSIHLPDEETANIEAKPPNEQTPAQPYIDPVSGKHGKAVAQLRYWMDTYEPTAGRPFELVYHEWDRPMLPPEYLQANCVRCHTEAYDIRDTAPVVYEGRASFTRLGCVNCHQMDSIPASQNRKVGPDLRHVTAKLSPAFINTWIWAPKAFRPSTKMPHFFMLENNSSDEEIRRTRQEARAITEYLVQTAEPLQPKYVVQRSYKGSVDAGHALFNSIGCLGCHNNLNDPTGETRVRSDGARRAVTLGEKWITQDLVKSGKILSEMKAMNPSAAEMERAATQVYDRMNYNQRQMYVLENLDQPGNGVAVAAYPDGTPKPIFIHHGPELSGIGTKLLAGRNAEQARQWLYDWLKEPRHYSDYTIMPQLRLSDQQAMDLSEYLLNQRRTNDSPNDDWTAGEAKPDDAKLRDMVALFLKSRYNNSIDIAYERAIDQKEMTAYAADALTTRAVDSQTAQQEAENLSLQEKQLLFLGKRLIAHYGCMSCHAINGTETISSPGTNLSDWGQKQVGRLAFGYLEPEKIEEHEVKDVMSIPMVNGMSAESCSLLTAGGAMSKPVAVTWPEVENTRRSWIEQKLKSTRIWDRGQVLLEPQPESDNLDLRLGKPYEKLRMPTFYLNEEQVHNLITFVLSNRDRLISDRLAERTENPAAVRIARGRELTERYNCVGCHQIENGSMSAPNTAQVQQWYKPEEMVDKAPPSLRGEGNKVQFAWLFNFFRNIQPMRPLLQPAGGIRMPSFPATSDEFTAIIDYFNAVSVKESKDLRQTLDPVVKYVSNANKTEQPPEGQTVELSNGLVWYNHPERPAANTWPGDDWINQPTLAGAAAALKEWSIEKKQMTEVDFDVTRNSAKDLQRSYRTALYKALFTEDLYECPYPFVDAPRPDLNDPNFSARFAKGQSLFHEMQCLNCHKLGDPDAEGAVKEPKGPNLSLVYQRLQRRWVRHWVQEPPVMQVNTKMPQFFSGISHMKIDGLPWAEAQGLPAAEVKRTADIYGATVEDQVNLVLDYLYAAGELRTTDVQPVKK